MVDTVRYLAPEVTVLLVSRFQQWKGVGYDSYFFEMVVPRHICSSAIAG